MWRSADVLRPSFQLGRANFSTCFMTRLGGVKTLRAEEEFGVPEKESPMEAYRNNRDCTLQPRSSGLS